MIICEGKMKKILIIAFLFLISLLAAETVEVTEQVNGPLYEKVYLIRDYRVNQPIKGIITWGTVGSIAGYTGSILYIKKNGEHNLSISKEATSIFVNTTIVSVAAGALHGFYKGFKSQIKRSKDPSYYIRRDKFGYEGTIMIDPFSSNDAITNKIIQGIGLTYDYQYRFIDEFQLGVGWIRWPEYEESNHLYEETKFDLKGIHYYCKSKILSPYYGLGGGLSYAKRRYNDLFIDDTKILSKGLYPFIHSSAGLRFSFLDFFYLKIESDFELSSFYFYANSYEGYSFLTNLTLGLVLGTKIF